MTEPATTGTAAILLKLGSVFPGVIGAAIALRFNTADLSASKRASAFLASIAIAHYLGGAVVEHWALAGMVAEAAKLAAGLFGLSVIASLMAEVPTIVGQLRRRYLGDRT